MKTILRIFVLTAFTLGNMNTLNAQWVLQTAEAHETLVDIVMLDSLKAVAIGHRNAILRTTDAGSSWINETIAISATYEWNSL
jgi:photosystem II stability/assembly factor-like uncharacterized protein